MLKAQCLPAASCVLFASCDPQLFDFVVAMKAAVSVFNLTLPDVVFIVNTDDAPVCNQEQVLKRECQVHGACFDQPCSLQAGGSRNWQATLSADRQRRSVSKVY